MHVAAQFFVFLAAAYAVSTVVWPGLALRRIGSWLVLACFAVVLFTPLLIGPQHVKLRALACVLAIDLFFKMVDYARQQRLGGAEVR